jgi:Ca2+-binding EF-hand superfamily protein
MTIRTAPNTAIHPFHSKFAQRMLGVLRQFTWQQAAWALGRMMPPAFILPLFAAAAASAMERPINVVVGHAWAPFISPMGEPFRPRTANDDTLARWFNQADRNHDGQLTPQEMKADADRFFTTLDTDGDGLIGPEELIHYEWELAPDVQLSARLRRQPGEAAPARTTEGGEELAKDRRYGRAEGEPDSMAGLQGAARYGLLNMPEPVAAADADFNRAITRAEFEQAALERFQLLGRENRGALTLPSLEGMWSSVLAKLHDRTHKAEQRDERVGDPLPPGR